MEKYTILAKALVKHVSSRVVGLTYEESVYADLTLGSNRRMLSHPLQQK